MSWPQVVVTALGAISPLALNSRRHFDRLLEGDSGVSPLEGPEYCHYPPLLQASVRDFDRRHFIPDRMLRKLLSPSPAFALAACTEALENASTDAAEKSRCGLYVGSVCLDANPEALIPALRASINERNELDLDRFASCGMKLVDPLFLVKSLPNAGLCAIAIQHQVLGPNANITNGAVSGLQAVAAAFYAIREGETDLAIAGAYDSLLQMDCVVEHLVAGRLALNVHAPERACRPFDRDRNGYALGEAAAFLVLESREHAERRGAQIYGEILSFGDSTDSKLLVEPDRGDAAALSAAACEALDSADVSPREVDAVFGDGTAVSMDDHREAVAYHEIFDGQRAPFTAATPATGYVGAASGAFGLLHAFSSIRSSVLPPILNCENPAPDCVLPLVQEARPASLKKVLVWTSDRGIKNAAMLIGACQD